MIDRLDPTASVTPRNGAPVAVERRGESWSLSRTDRAVAGRARHAAADDRKEFGVRELVGGGRAGVAEECNGRGDQLLEPVGVIRGRAPIDRAGRGISVIRDDRA